MFRLRSHLIPLFLIIFIFFSIITPTFTQAAATPNIFGIVGVKTLQDYVKEFCDKRSGDLMNLETWYSGKCAPGVDTWSGDGVGFVDIVILQTFEWINTLTFNSPTDSFVDSVINSIKLIQGIHDKIQSTSWQQGLNSVALFPTNNIGGLGILGRLATGISTIRPASTADYGRYIASNLQKHQVISDTYAAGPGYGFTALTPILPLWRAFRNIAYMLFAIGFVLYGIMIMFRVRIDSKTAATIQLAVPKLVATLLMITFSYAIVGFLIDISTIAGAMAINILKTGGILHSSWDFIPKVVAGQSFFGAVGSFFVNTISAMIVTPFIFFNLIIGGLGGIIVGAIVGAVGLLSGFGIVVGIIVIIAVAISYFKLIMKLFQAFFGIIINLIFAPIILLGNLLPGSTAFSDWLRTIYGNLAVFPVAIFFLTLSFALMCQPLLSFIALLDGFTGLGGTAGLEALLGVRQLSTLQNIWVPPLTMPLDNGSLTSGGAGSVGSLMLATIGFGLLLMASKYCEMVEKALKVPPFPYGAAIGEALKYGAGQTGKIRADYIPRLPGPVPTWLTKQSLTAASSAGGSKATGAPPTTPPPPPPPIP